VFAVYASRLLDNLAWGARGLSYTIRLQRDGGTSRRPLTEQIL
jgi:hypothetical protein